MIVAKLKEKWWLFGAMLHMFFSMLISRHYFTFSDFSVPPMYLTMDNTISLQAERVMMFIISIAMAVLIILALWYLLFCACTKRIPVKFSLIAVAMMSLGIVYILGTFPFEFAGDHAINYSFAVRLLPYYWHNTYTTAVFAASLMAFPHPIFIQILKLFTVIVWVCYASYKFEQVFGKKMQWIPYAFLVIPDGMTLMFSVHRNSYFNVLILFIITYIVFENLEKKIFERRKMLYVLPILSYTAVWRSEGIILSILLFSILLIVIYKVGFKQFILWLSIFLVCIYVLSVPSKVGNRKYLGSDYLIISTLAPLQAIVNDENRNFQYDNVEDDIRSISKIVPIDLVGMVGMQAFHSVNAEEGRDIDQSAANSVDTKGYIVAFTRVVLHNPTIFIKERINNFLITLGTSYPFSIGEYHGGESLLYEARYHYYNLQADAGMEELKNTKGTGLWLGSGLHEKLQFKIYTIQSTFNNIWNATKFNISLRVGTIIFSICYCVKNWIAFLKRKKQEGFCFLLLLSCGVAQLVILALTIPYTFELYLYPTLSYLYFVCIIMFLEKGYRNNEELDKTS